MYWFSAHSDYKEKLTGALGVFGAVLHYIFTSILILVPLCFVFRDEWWCILIFFFAILASMPYGVGEYLNLLIWICSIIIVLCRRPVVFEIGFYICAAVYLVVYILIPIIVARIHLRRKK